MQLTNEIACDITNCIRILNLLGSRKKNPIYSKNIIIANVKKNLKYQWIGKNMNKYEKNNSKIKKKKKIHKIILECNCH